VALSPTTRAYLAESYPDERMPSIIALLLVGVLVLWLTVFAVAFVGPLRRHRTGDKELVATLEALRADARHPAPRLGFYVGVVAALALMALLVSMRISG
jgi:multisubunit Na+/H+ antiporter MnhB subunit